MHHLKTEKRVNNARSARMPTLKELYVDNNSLQLLQP
jgi:hypothetical protein